MNEKERKRLEDMGLLFKQKSERPEIIGKAVPIYDNEYEEIPFGVRISFSNGHTAVYELRVNQPAPVILENIRIIRRMKVGYNNQPPQRRGKNEG